MGVWGQLPGCSNREYIDSYGWSKPLTVDISIIDIQDSLDRPLWHYALSQKGDLVPLGRGTLDPRLVSGSIFTNRRGRTSSVFRELVTKINPSEDSPFSAPNTPIPFGRLANPSTNRSVRDFNTQAPINPRCFYPLFRFVYLPTSERNEIPAAVSVLEY
ncbi:hypothetical protein K0M31_010822 [Melipona bicolor]|uniref:Uncharacterized protein n=1 Tax=Melipona bicolor TaxID=60889 RepID=A0AA40FLQ1_9HYME|nr:hypothetical protein K0M31_010822 [Melipona bicolor]